LGFCGVETLEIGLMWDAILNPPSGGGTTSFEITADELAGIPFIIAALVAAVLLVFASVPTHDILTSTECGQVEAS